MRAVLAIALLTIRTALRSRVVLTLLVILTLAVTAMPATLRGDGTVEGYVQILLNYTLGFAQAILAVSTLWAGCAAIAADIGRKSMQLTAVKPVTRAQIWFGKWLGIVTLNAALLAFCGVAAYAMLQWNTRPGRLAEADRAKLHREVLVARTEVRPEPVDIEERAREMLRVAVERGEAPADVPREEVLAGIREELGQAVNTVPPGYRRRWIFQLPPSSAAATSIALRVKFGSSRTGDAPVRGLWICGTIAEPERHEAAFEGVVNASHEIVLPGAIFAGSREAVVDFANVDPDPVTVIFDRDRGVTLLVPSGGFAANLLRSMLVLFARLAFLAALGVCAGSFFTLPVAAFLSISFMSLVMSGDYIQSLATRPEMLPIPREPGQAPGFTARAAQGFYWVLAKAVQPLQGEDTLGRLSTGLAVPWVSVARAGLVEGVLYGLILAGLGTWALNRREIAMPTI